VIKADIRRVLDRMQVQYREKRSGFECIHIPSIDVSSVQESDRQQLQQQQSRHNKHTSNSSEVSPFSRKSLGRKASKLSFGTKTKDSVQGRDSEHLTEKPEKDLPGRPSGLSTTPSNGSSLYFNGHHNPAAARRAGSPSPSDMTSVAINAEEIPRPSTSPPGGKTLPPIPRDYDDPTPRANTPAMTPFPTGEVDKETFETISGNTMSVRFEISIVKVRMSIYFLLLLTDI
jgi:serine/threonine protein kinase KIN1/2